MARKLAICGLLAIGLAHAGPTPAQVRAAVRRAERSRQLWATVNICDTPGYPDRIGIRGQMPTLGFSARLSMSIQAEYWDPVANAFRPVPGPTGRAQVKLGRLSRGLVQSGHTFQFPPGAGLLSGEITFRWRLGHKLLGSVTKPATGGHHGVQDGDPPGYSAASCTIS